MAKDGVNAVKTFFEHHGCGFQDVAQQNDFGKDGYLDFGERGVVTPLSAALQIKSGNSFRTAKGEYFIPVETHANTWRGSTIPIFGIVYDPDDRLLRWIDITGYLLDNPKLHSGNIPVSRHATLDEISLRDEFKAALKKYAAAGFFGRLTLNLLAPGPLQTDAVYDAWALGRSDAKYLLIVRRLIMDLEKEALRRAIFLLSHAGSHPNIFDSSEEFVGELRFGQFAK
jgi:hypothetical protein